MKTLLKSKKKLSHFGGGAAQIMLQSLKYSAKKEQNALFFH